MQTAQRRELEGAGAPGSANSDRAAGTSRGDALRAAARGTEGFDAQEKLFQPGADPVQMEKNKDGKGKSDAADKAKDDGAADSEALQGDPAAAERALIRTLHGTGTGLVATARAVRAEIDGIAAEEQAPEAGLMQQLQGLRDAQVPIWQQIVSLRDTARAKEASDSPKKDAKGAPRPSDAMADEAAERLLRLAAARRRQSLDAINASLANDKLEAEERTRLEAEREKTLNAMMMGDGAQMERMRQSDPRWGSIPYTSNDGRKLLDEAGKTPLATLGRSACGAVSLAMVVNFLDRENPEAEVIGDKAQVLRAVAAVYRMKARRDIGGVGAGTNWNGIAGNFDANGQKQGEQADSEGVLNTDPKAAGDLSHLKGNRVAFADLIPTLQSGHPVVWGKPKHYVVIKYYDPHDKTGMPLRVADPATRKEMPNSPLKEVAEHPALWVLKARTPST